MSIPQNSESRGDETVTLKIPRTRVMFIETADGTSPTGNPIGFNLTGIENIDTMNPLRGVIRTKCDLGHWHPESEITLLPWPSQ